VRIVLLTPTYDGRDGLSCLAREVAAAAARQGDVKVLSLAGSDMSGDVEVVGCAGSRRRLGTRAVTAAATAPDVLVVLHTHLLPLALPLLAAGARLVHVLVGIEAWQPLSRLQDQALRRASAVVAISHHTVRRFHAANPAHADREVTVCHPSTPLLPSAPAPDAETPAAGFALIVGRMVAEERYKGHDALIDAWPVVQSLSPDARLVVVGDGDDRTRLERRAIEAGLSASIRFTGRVDNDTLALLYERAGVFVLPSLNEGFGYVFLEAMRAGRACIGAPGAAAEIIEAGVTGLIADPPHSEALATAVAHCLNDTDAAARMGLAGRHRAESVFAPERFADAFARVLREVGPC
jgi:phosphatidyl-myo-inositol dimannoside synthase